MELYILETNKQANQAALTVNCSKRPNHKQKLSVFFFISALNCYRYEDTLCICPCCCRFLSVTFLLRASGTQWMWRHRGPVAPGNSRDTALRTASVLRRFGRFLCCHETLKKLLLFQFLLKSHAGLGLFNCFYCHVSRGLFLCTLCEKVFISRGYYEF